MKHFIAILLCAILSSGCSFVSPAKQKDLVARVDQSPSGKISKQEFVDWNIKRIFKLYDRGGKGYVTLQDWQAAHGLPPEPPVLARFGVRVLMSRRL